MTDTSREAVNRLIHWNIQSLETACALGLPIKDHPHEKCAMVLGEFLDERDRLREALRSIAKMDAGSPSWAAQDALKESNNG